MLYTIGYEGLDVFSVVDALKAHGVRVLIDVRELPLSRKRGFSKTALSEALADAGVQYVHLKELGAPRPVRHALRADGDWNEYCRGYYGHLDLQDEALRLVAELARAQNTCLLCFEADYRECHRSLIAERLESLGHLGRAVHLSPQRERAAKASA